MNLVALNKNIVKLEPYLSAAMTKAGITSSLRVAHFLAQLSHESGNFRYMKELWGPTSSQLRYERNFNEPWPASSAQARQAGFKVNKLAYTLGNSQRGDGKKFMGHGPIQVTGRYNHGRYSRLLFGDDRLLDKPELLATPEHGAAAAVMFWTDKGLARFADADDIEGLTRKVNGGLNGLDDRREWLRIYKGKLGIN